MRKALADPEGMRHRVGLARARVEQELSFAARNRTLEATYAELYTRRHH
jgi:hypothetical protein